MTWTKEEHEAAKRETERNYMLPLVTQREMLAEIEREWAEIERLTARHAEQAQRIEGLEQANREAHQAIAKRNAEVERLTRELATPAAAHATADLNIRADLARRAFFESSPGSWLSLAPTEREPWQRVARALDADRADLERELVDLRRTVNDGIEITHEQAIKNEALKGEVERLKTERDTARDAAAKAKKDYEATLANLMREQSCHRGTREKLEKAEALRPGLTEEQALATAGPLSRDIYNRIGLATGNKIGAPEWMRDIIAAALLRASRGALAPGDISVSRAILERLAKAAESDSDAREARWAAERILQQAPLAAEPARTDPEAARRLAEARAERDQLDTKFRSYDGGDRPQSPPVSLIRDLRAAEERVRELEAAK